MLIDKELVECFHHAHANSYISWHNWLSFAGCYCCFAYGGVATGRAESCASEVCGDVVSNGVWFESLFDSFVVRLRQQA